MPFKHNVSIVIPTPNDSKDLPTIKIIFGFIEFCYLRTTFYNLLIIFVYLGLFWIIKFYIWTSVVKFDKS